MTSIAVAMADTSIEVIPSSQTSAPTPGENAADDSCGYQPSARSAISRICFAISSGERMKSMQPLSIALCGISG